MEREWTSCLTHLCSSCANKAYCDCFQSGVFCDPSQCECLEGCHLIPLRFKRYYVHPTNADNSKEPAGAQHATTAVHNPLAYNMPLHVHQTMVPGVCFSRADPRYNVLAMAPKKPPPSRHLYHNLMLSPSKPIRSPVAGRNNKGLSGLTTTLEGQWKQETDKLVAFFGQLKDVAKTQLESDDPTVVPKQSDEATAAIYKKVLEDMEAVKNVMEESKTNIQTLLWERKKHHKSKNPKKRVEDMDWERTDEHVDSSEKELRCSETLPPMAEPQQPPPDDSDQLRELLVHTVQDTAMMREMARILRRKARELATMRARDAKAETSSVTTTTK
jgi:hypothetical protein